MSYTTAAPCSEALAKIMERLPIMEKLKRRQHSKSALQPNLPFSDPGAKPIEYEKRKQQEIEGCKRCRGLRECQYAAMGNLGFRPIWSKWSPHYEVVKECSYKVAQNTQLRIERLFKASGIPPRERKKLDELEASSAVEVLIDHVLGQKEGVYISGASGTGKTELASAAGNSLIAEGVEVLYLTVPDLVTELRYKNEMYHARLEEVSQVESLILEDLGSERMSEYNEEQLELVLDRRLREGRRTLITSEWRISELRYESKRLRNRLKRLEEVAI